MTAHTSTSTPTLAELIQASAHRMTDVTVTVDSAMETVCIQDDDGVQDDIFMQGDDAAQFIDQRDALYEQVQTLGKDVIELHLAGPYAECIWGVGRG